MENKYLRYIRGEQIENSRYGIHHAWNIADFVHGGVDVKTKKYIKNADFLEILSTTVDNMKKAGYSISDIDIKVSFSKKIENSDKDIIQIINIDNDDD